MMSGMGASLAGSTPTVAVEAGATTAHDGSKAVATTPKQKPLSDEELRERLGLLSSPAVVKELYEIAQQQVEVENGRQTRLDAKATSLLTAAGLSLTVAFTFGGQLLIAHHKTGSEHFEISAVGLLAFALALASGLLAAGLAMWSLRVRDKYFAIEEDAVFSPAVLKVAEDIYHPETAGTDEGAVTEYRKALTPHLWKISQKHLEVHQKKATIIKLGQWAFLVFLGAIVLISFSVVVRIIW